MECPFSRVWFLVCFCYLEADTTHLFSLATQGPSYLSNIFSVLPSWLPLAPTALTRCPSQPATTSPPRLPPFQAKEPRLPSSSEKPSTGNPSPAPTRTFQRRGEQSPDKASGSCSCSARPSTATAHCFATPITAGWPQSPFPLRSPASGRAGPGPGRPHCSQGSLRTGHPAPGPHPEAEAPAWAAVQCGAAVAEAELGLNEGAAGEGPLSAPGPRLPRTPRPLPPFTPCGRAGAARAPAMSYNKIPPRWLHCPRRGQPVAGERPARSGPAWPGPVRSCPAPRRLCGGSGDGTLRCAPLPAGPGPSAPPLLLSVAGASVAPPGPSLTDPAGALCPGAGRPSPLSSPGRCLSRSCAGVEPPRLLPTGALMLGSCFALVKFRTKTFPVRRL